MEYMTLPASKKPHLLLSLPATSFIFPASPSLLDHGTTYQLKTMAPVGGVTQLTGWL